FEPGLWTARYGSQAGAGQALGAAQRCRSRSLSRVSPGRSTAPDAARQAIALSASRSRAAAPAVGAAEASRCEALRRPYSLAAEMAILLAVVVVWQAVRIPLAGSVPEALAHARDWVEAERALGVDIEPSLIRFVHERDDLHHLAELFYSNLDPTVVFGFFAAARLLAPLRY